MPETVLSQEEKGNIRVVLLDIQHLTLVHHPCLTISELTQTAGPSCSDDEKETKRMRSASTTLRSLRGTDPDEYHRIMGFTSVGSRETVRFGEESVSGLESNQRELRATQLIWMKPKMERTYVM